MISLTDYKCPVDLIEKIYPFFKDLETPVTLNQPTGDFFTDPWQIKFEYKDTVFDEVLSTLSREIGQARIIKLDPAKCYHCHADIDDRYHLNLQGEQCYLINLDDQQMYEIKDDGIWYDMDASKIHSAVNFGRYTRYQLVVRKLLSKNILRNPVKIKIFSSDLSHDDARFIFDNTISPWLNISCKKGLISNFKNQENYVDLLVEKDYLVSLNNIRSKNIGVEIYD